MKLFKKSAMSLALTVAMLGGVAVTSQVSAVPVANSGSDASGDILLFPYYTTENGFRTQISLTNSSNKDTTIAKIRLRDYKDSNDVLDITVVLSPSDVFAGTIHSTTVGGVKRTAFTRSSDDTTCTSPIAVDRSFVQGGANPNPNGAMGHIEVITMATIPYDISVADYEHLARVVANSTHSSATGDTPAGGCGIVDSYFDLTAGTTGYEISDLQEELTRLYAADAAAAAADPALPEPVNVRSNLFGSYSVFKSDGGIAAAGRPTTIAGALDGNLASPCNEADIDGDGNVDAADLNTSIICAQVADKGHFTFPHLLHVAGVNATLFATTDDRTNNITAFTTFQNAIASSGMASEWSRNTENNVQSEMTLSLPTKYVIRDDYPATTSASTADWNNLVRTTSKNVFTGAPYVSSPVAEDKWDNVDEALYTGNEGAVAADNGWFIDSGIQAGCLSFSRTTIDREEQTFTPMGGGTSVSGGQENAVVEQKICNETNVFTFGDGEGVTQPATADIVLKLDTTSLSQNFGWLKVYARDESNNNYATLPMIGYTMSSRELAGASQGNFAQLVNNVRLALPQD